MGLVILLAVGGILGWVSSIVCAVKNARATVLYVAASVVGALLTGIVVAPVSVLEAITPLSVLAGGLGAIGAFATTRFAYRQLVSS